MSDSEPAGASGENTSDNAPENEPELLDINGNPIPRNWNPADRPAAPDAEPPGANQAAGKSANGSRPANVSRPAAPGSRPAEPRPAPRPYQPAPRQAAGGGFAPGHGAMPGEEERLDLSGKPLPPMKASSAPMQPTYSSAGRSGPGPSRAKSGGGNPLGVVFGLILLALIAGAGYVMYTKNQANLQNQAKPEAAATSPSDPAAGKKAHTGHKSPFGGKQ